MTELSKIFRCESECKQVKAQIIQLIKILLIYNLKYIMESWAVFRVCNKIITGALERNDVLKDSSIANDDSLLHSLQLKLGKKK